MRQTELALNDEARRRLGDQLIKLGDMLGDGLGDEPDGKWIGQEYRRVAKALGYCPPQGKQQRSDQLTNGAARERGCVPHMQRPAQANAIRIGARSMRDVWRSLSAAQGEWSQTMKVLSVRQPWAWLIIHGGKDIENRTWATKYRGRFLVHASQGMTRAEYCEALELVMRAAHIDVLRGFPMFGDLQRGGIVGSVELVDCVTTSDSPWYRGDVGFVLRDPKPLPFTRYKGRLGLFNAPELEGLV